MIDSTDAVNAILYHIRCSGQILGPKVMAMPAVLAARATYAAPLVTVASILQWRGERIKLERAL